MRSGFRSVLAVVAGFVLASVIMMVVEFVNGHHLYPELGKAAEGMKDPEAIRQLMASAPVGALLVVIVGWVLGSLAGGFAAAWIGERSPARHALVLGGILTFAGIANNLMIPPPLWFWIAGLVVFLPATCVGGKLAPRRAAA